VLSRSALVLAAHHRDQLRLVFCFLYCHLRSLCFYYTKQKRKNSFFGAIRSGDRAGGLTDR